ncbi:MAG: TauD/TfdA family dioxygenase [Alphaproteobacteria bacterium]|nr:TauD/TfdA family dioxygenase [Alphaproteobacteria bacterium]
MRRCRDWVRSFSPAEIAELETALRQSRHLEIVDVDRAAFPLPTLADELIRLRDEVVEGRGFVLLKGLPIERYTREDAARIYWGIGCHLGKAVSQNGKGHLLGHVRDLGYDVADPNVRVYQTTERQYYHADSCDIVALLCLATAKRGGLSSLVSSTTLYNEMMARRPDLAALLSEPVAFDRRGEVPAGEKPFYMMRIFNHHDGLISGYYVRRYAESAARHADAPKLTEAHREAFDLLDALADDEDLHLEMQLDAGDIQLVHNHTVFHDRTAYEDWTEPDRKRHLLRLWLCPPNGRPLPPAYKQRWGGIEIGDRGGIVVPGAALNVPLEPV